MADRQAMTAWDHVLVQAVMALTTMRVHDPVQAALLREVLERDWPGAPSPIPQVQALACAAREMLQAEDGTARWARATIDAEAALHRFAIWRLGLALDIARSNGGS